MVRIITDSTTDLDQALYAPYGLTVLPLIITLKDQNYLDGEEISVQQVYAAMRQGTLPKTALIPPERVRAAFAACAQRGEDCIYIAFSSEMSGCCNMAENMAREARDAFPGRRIAVVDSRGGSSATGLIVLQALKMAAAGMGFDALLSEIAFMVAHVEHVFSVADLEWLAKGGRIPRVVGFLGGKLNIRPLLDVENGKMTVKGMVRGNKKAVLAVANEIAKRAKAFPDQLIAVNHADDPAAALLLCEQIKALLPQCKTTVCHIGGVLGAHIGLSGVGAYCFTLRPAHYIP